MQFPMKRFFPFLMFWLMLLIPFIHGQGALPEWGENIRRILAGTSPAEVSKYFAPMLEIKVPGYQGFYSDAQATQILRTYFEHQAERTVSLLEQGIQEDGSEYLLGRIKAGDQKYRFYLACRKKGTGRVIHLFQIQESQ